MLHKMLDNYLLAIPKSKHTFMLNKPAYVGLKPKMYSFLVDDNSEHKARKGCKQKCCCNNKS